MIVDRAAPERDESLDFARIEPAIRRLLRLQAAGQLPDVPVASSMPCAERLSPADERALDALGPNVGQHVLEALGDTESGDDGLDDSEGSEPISADVATEAAAGKALAPPAADSRSTSPEESATTPIAGYGPPLGDLARKYQQILSARRVGAYRLERLLGRGGQGEVYLTERRGADGFNFWMASKVFSPEPYRRRRSYETEMERIAGVAHRVARGNHDHVVGVQRFNAYDGIRVMVMEWVDGLDLRRLMHRQRLEQLKSQISDSLWNEIQQVVVSLAPGAELARFQPGAAVTIARNCLRGLMSLHQQGIVHGDLKPSNIMVQWMGTAKLIDLGSAIDWHETPQLRAITPAYAAPEAIERFECTPASDLASLGYVLIEMLSGRSLFSRTTGRHELLEAKRSLPERLRHLLPKNVTECEMLVELCRRLIDPNPAKRFESAEQADLDPACGASAFLFALVKGNLGCVFEKPIALWVEAMKPLGQVPLLESVHERSLITDSTWTVG